MTDTWREERDEANGSRDQPQTAKRIKKQSGEPRKGKKKFYVPPEDRDYSDRFRQHIFNVSHDF